MNVRIKMVVGGVMATAAAIAVAGMASAAPRPNIGGGNPTPAPASTASHTCSSKWDDGVTFGITCQSQAASFRFQAMATCRNGLTVYGQTVGSNATSYAYCSSVGSTYLPGSGKERIV